VAPIGLIRKAGRRRGNADGWRTRPVTGAVSIEDARKQY
jgi:hypothetical protein